MSTMILQVSMLKPSDLMSWPGRQIECDRKIFQGSTIQHFPR